MSAGAPRSLFDVAAFDATARTTVPGYAALQELVACAAASGLRPDARVLDVGCGTGAGLVALATALPRATIVGVDPDADMVATARERAASTERVEVRVGGVEAIDDGPFDAIVSTLVWHFVDVPARPAWLRALRSRLAPGGALVLTAVCRRDAASNARYAKLRQTYASEHGVTPERFAALTSKSACGATPVAESEAEAALLEAGFTAVTPILQLLAVRTWLADAGELAVRG